MVAMTGRQATTSGKLADEAGPSDLLPALLAAAEEGVASAQFVVRHMYLYGEGVRRDKVLAYKWLLLAEQAEEAFSDASRRARKKFGTELLSVQLPEAERMVSQWL